MSQLEKTDEAGKDQLPLGPPAGPPSSAAPTAPATPEPDRLDPWVPRIVVLLLEHFGDETDEEKIAAKVREAIGRARDHQRDDADIDDRLGSWSARIGDWREEYRKTGPALVGLSQWVLHRPGKPWWVNLGRLAEWVIDHWAASSAILAVVAAAIARIAYAQYYGVFDLSPEDAGVDTTRVLTGSVPGVLLAVVLLSAFVAVVITPLLAVQDATRARIEHGVHGRQRKRDVYLFLATCLIPFLVAAYVLMNAEDLILRAPVDEYEESLFVFTAVGAAFGALFSLFWVTPLSIGLAIRARCRKLSPVVAPSGRSYLLTAVLAVPTFLTLVFLLLPAAARSRAGDVLDGLSVDSVAVFGAPALDVHAPQVTLVKAPPELVTGACYTLIASSDSGVTLYDPGAGRIYRVAQDQVVVSRDIGDPC
jgi:hypothetical protein